MSDGKPPTEKPVAVKMSGGASRLKVDSLRVFGYADAVRMSDQARDVTIDDITLDATAASDTTPQQPQQNGGDRPSKNWHETALGKIGIGLTIAVLGAAAILAITHWATALGL